MMASLLAFDTSTEAMAVALQSPHGVSVWNGAGGPLASATLLPKVQQLLHAHGIGVASLDAVAFGAGPGAFTGLRTACSVAQGLAFGAGRPVLPINSLLLVAEDARAQHGGVDGFDVGVVMDARMGELYAARYAWRGGAWATASAPVLCDPGALRQLWSGAWPAVVAGSGVHLLAILSAPPADAVLMPQAADRASALLRLAQQAHAQGAAITAAQALPVYLRDKVALTTLERAAKHGTGEALA